MAILRWSRRIGSSAHLVTIRKMSKIRAEVSFAPVGRVTVSPCVNGADVELTHHRIMASSADTVRRCSDELLKVGEVKEIYEMKGAGRSIRGIAGELGIARNTVRRYLKSPEAVRAKPRPQRASKLDPYPGYIDSRLDEWLENCVVLPRELRARGYDGGYSILNDYVSPRRRPRQPDATMRLETAPGEQAQMDWGSLAYIGEDGKKRRIWVFVMTMGWSRACYVELVRKADTAAFIQCHVNAFEYLGGVPRRCLYDNAKVVTLGRTRRSGRCVTK